EGPYKPTWESLDAHPAPEWFDDAKLGMFVDWGLYSIGGWAPRKPEGAMYPDWYVFNMYHDKDVMAYHKKAWGEQFQRDDFIPLFTATEYTPDALTDLAVEAGMKYIVPFCKHHDGFCLWDSSLTGRDAADMGPKRDLIKPMIEACRTRGLKFGFYFSVDEWEYPILGEKGERLVRVWGQGPVKTIPYDEKEMAGKIGGKVPVHDFVAEYIVPQAKEFVVKYDPDILWFDGEWDLPAEQRGTWDIVSFFYNHAEGRKPVAVNDRIGAGTRAKHGDFFTSEFHDGNMSLTHKWEENRSIGQSYGYNRDDTDDNVLSPGQLIHMFVDTVSQGGNLLLMVNLTGPGALPDMQVKRLKAMGAWLKVNGEAIYGSRQYRVTKEGDVRFTRSKDSRYVYAILPAWPDTPIILKSVRAVPGSAVTMLGVREALAWTQDEQALTVRVPGIPAASRPCEHACVLRFEAERQP
ncbi:MAG: alpha-L-fucosidase, partial [Candidatus Hydrogenedentes bacterium]|nr:alpha-L-fucosidase [Candidatus Hydrogenedentota bacterium]